MFRMNGNRRRPRKTKSLNNVNQNTTNETKTEYQEDFNEVILNDLVPNDKKEEFGLEDTSKSKKSSGLKINLGLGGKKTSKKTSNKKKTQNNEQESIEEKPKNKKASNNTHHENKKHSNSQDIEESIPKHNNHQNKKHKSNKNNESEQSTPSKSTKPKHVKKQTHHNHSSSYIEPEVDEAVESINTKKDYNNIVEETPSVNKKGSKKVHQNKRRKHRPSQTVQDVQDIEDLRSEENEHEEIQIQEIVEESSDDSNINTSFRGTEEKQNDFNEENLKKKFENLVWSEDKFPKK